MDDKIKYNDDITETCKKALVEGMVAAGVDPGYIFQAGTTDDGTEMEDVESKLSFMTHLLPNLRPGCDMYVCMPPIKNAESPSAEPDWGTKKGSIQPCLSLPRRADWRGTAIQALLHNVDQGMSAKPTEKEVAEGRPANQNYIPVDEDFYLYTNVNITSRPNIAGVQFDWNNSLRSSELDEEAKKAVMQKYPKTAERMKPNWVSYKNALLTFQANQSNTIGDVLEQTVHSMKLPFLYKQDQIGSNDTQNRCLHHQPQRPKVTRRRRVVGVRKSYPILD